MSVTVWSGAVERNESDLPQLPVIQSRARARVANVPVARPFEVQGAFSVPGTVDNKMDGTATEDMDYTYRLRCEKGEKYSDYSNEMMANPTHAAGAGG